MFIPFETYNKSIKGYDRTNILIFFSLKSYNWTLCLFLHDFLMQQDVSPGRTLQVPLA